MEQRQWSIKYEYYNVGNEIIYNTEVLKHSLSDYNDAYILVRGNATTEGRCNIVTQVAFKNCASFTKCITNIYGTTIDDAEDLDLVMPIQNQTEYGSNYSESTGNLWFY